MIRKSDVTALATVVLLGVGGLAASSAQAQSSPPAKPGTARTADAAAGTAARPAQRPASKSARQKAPEPEPVVAEADASQIEAVERVYTGSSDCEFNQKILVEPSRKHVGYVELQHGKKSWLMRPVVSPTGAVRLEDVRAEALLIQIGSKTMLLNQKTGQRIVDDCRHAKQRDAGNNVAGGGIGISSDAPVMTTAGTGGVPAAAATAATLTVAAPAAEAAAGSTAASVPPSAE